jgi:D-alanyl-lipoteichoic acid acyltransferase DltB (MBOAT superfamily)
LSYQGITCHVITLISATGRHIRQSPIRAGIFFPPKGEPVLFNSYHFLAFFPVVTLLYFAIPHRFRYLWLLGASYYFYMAWNPKYALLLTLSIVITWLSGLLIYRSNKKGRPGQKKLWVALSLILNLGILFFFKYFRFAMVNINLALGHFAIPPLEAKFDVLLPVGISFYTFQALSYTMDVYRGEIYAEKNFLKYALFVSFFPQLVAGPIERSKNLLIQINDVHRFDFDRVKNGLLLMLWGYFQKMVIADRAALLVNNVFNNWQNYYGFEIVIAAVFFAFQIYGDFAGYSDIAIGAAEVMGFRLMENFREPYFALSIKDFWRRWHISLSTWLRDYLYIPLGGNRCSRPRRYFNIMATFIASGAWHGASWNFIFWGGLHGAYQVIGDILKPAADRVIRLFRINTGAESYRLFQIIRTFILVDIGWIFFRAAGFKNALHVGWRVVKDGLHPWIFFDGGLYKLGLNEIEFRTLVTAVFILLAVNFYKFRHPGASVRAVVARQNLAFKYVFYILAVFGVLMFGMYGPEFRAQDFIYFQF